MKRTHARKRPQKVAVALGAVLVTAGCASTPSQNASVPVENVNRHDGGVEQLLIYCGKLQDSGELLTAASICERAHNLAPSDPRPLLKLGEIFAAMDRLPQAVTAYQMILEQTPHHTEARYLLGKTYVAMGHQDLALRELQFALTQNPNDARVYNALGIANSLLGDQDAARQSFENGLKVAPRDIPLRNNLGLALVLAGKHADGIAILQAAATDPAANATTIRNLRLAESMAQSASGGPALGSSAPVYEATRPARSAQIASTATDAEFASMTKPAMPTTQRQAQPYAAPPAVPAEPVMLAEALKPLSDDTQMTAVGEPVFLDSDASIEEADAAPEAETESDIAVSEPGAETGEDTAASETPAEESEGPAIAESMPADTSETVAAEQEIAETGDVLDELTAASMPRPTMTANAELPPGEVPVPTARLQPTMSADVTMPQPLVMAPKPPQMASLSGEDIYSVQLASYRSADRAQDGWRQIRAKALDLLENVDPVIQRSDLGVDKGVYFRLRTKPSSKAAANQLCTALLSRGISCLTIKESPVATDKADMPAAAKS